MGFSEMKEQDIIYERDGFYVLAVNNAYVVFRPAPSFTHAFTDSGYERDKDGLSLAKARVDYLARMATL